MRLQTYRSLALLFAALAANLACQSAQKQTFLPPAQAQAPGKGKSARATVLFNGVKIYDQQALDLPHGAAGRLGEAPTGPLMLQEHGMPVQFRNIWLTTSNP